MSNISALMTRAAAFVTVFTASIFCPTCSFAQDVWATGYYTYHSADGGITWTRQGIGGYAVKFTDPMSGWVVGANYTIRHTTDGGANWSAQVFGTGTSAALRALAFPDPSNGWAVGDRGLILHTGDGGATWNPQSSGLATYQTLYGVSFPDATNGWAVSGGGDLIHTVDGGATWTAQPAQGGWCNDVEFVDALHGWIVSSGAGSQKLRYTSNGGITWTNQYSTLGHYPLALSFADGSNAWAVGTSGQILNTTDAGTTWILQRPATEGQWNLNDVSFVDSLRGWAVSDDGIILRTNDGGNTWNSQTSGSNLSLYGVSAVAPEPSAIGLIGLGALALGRRARGWRQSRSLHRALPKETPNTPVHGI